MIISILKGNPQVHGKLTNNTQLQKQNANHYKIQKTQNSSGRNYFISIRRNLSTSQGGQNMHGMSEGQGIKPGHDFPSALGFYRTLFPPAPR